jgi:hypothetical protein
MRDSAVDSIIRVWYFYDVLGELARSYLPSHSCHATLEVCTYPGVLAKIFCSNVDTYKVGTFIISD